MNNMIGKPSDPMEFFRDAKFVKAKDCAWLKDPFCVEVAHKDNLVGIRDSKNPGGPVLAYTKKEWRTFVAGVRNGEFDF
jgi:Domain of unknown function (DUF397)